MAHNIQHNDGMVLIGKPAWHGIGKVLPEAVTPQEALVIGGMDWTVEESDALTATFGADSGNPERVAVETHKTLRRSDDKSVLATVGSEYCVLQNNRLADIASSLGSAGVVRVETAGTLNGGRRCYFLLKGDTVDIGGRGDMVEEYLFIANSHDGSLALTAFPTSIRVVCANTMTMALQELRSKNNSGAYRWKHTSGLEVRIDEIKAVLANWTNVTTDNREAMRALASKTLTRSEIQQLWTDVLVSLDGEIAVNPKNEAQHRRKAKAVSELAYMSKVFDQESQQFGASAWVAANALTNLIQHSRGTLRGEARVNADLLGSYGDAKKVAMKAALALV